jgi:hypothetical protein
MRQSRNSQAGYLAAAFGGLVGAAAFIALGRFLGIAYAQQFMPNAELEGLIPLGIGIFLGGWIGEILGCWLCISFLRYQKAGSTAVILALLAPLGIGLFWFLLIGFAIGFSLPGFIFLAGLILFALPLLARVLANIP